MHGYGPAGTVAVRHQGVELCSLGDVPVPLEIDVPIDDADVVAHRRYRIGDEMAVREQSIGEVTVEERPRGFRKRPARRESSPGDVARVARLNAEKKPAGSGEAAIGAYGHVAINGSARLEIQPHGICGLGDAVQRLVKVVPRS